MDIEKFGYAAAAYFSEEDKNIAYFETAKGFLINHSLSLASSLLRQSLLKPKTMPAKIEKADGKIKIILNQGRGSIAEVSYTDISHSFNLDKGSIYRRD